MKKRVTLSGNIHAGGKKQTQASGLGLRRRTIAKNPLLSFRKDHRYRLRNSRIHRLVFSLATTINCSTQTQEQTLIACIGHRRVETLRTRCRHMRIQALGLLSSSHKRTSKCPALHQVHMKAIAMAIPAIQYLHKRGNKLAAAFAESPSANKPSVGTVNERVCVGRLLGIPSWVKMKVSSGRHIVQESLEDVSEGKGPEPLYRVRADSGSGAMLNEPFTHSSRRLDQYVSANTFATDASPKAFWQSLQLKTVNREIFR